MMNSSKYSNRVSRLLHQLNSVHATSRAATSYRSISPHTTTSHNRCFTSSTDSISTTTHSSHKTQSPQITNDNTNIASASQLATGRVLDDTEHITQVSLLPPAKPMYRNNLTVVLDMDETMV